MASWLLIFCIFHSIYSVKHAFQSKFQLLKKHINTVPRSNIRRRRKISLLTDGFINPSVSNDYFYAILNIGTPLPQRIEMALDTGSALPYFACKSTCTHCGTHDDIPFNINKSAYFAWISCQNKLCGSAAHCINDQCEWKQSYYDGSSISAMMGNDLISFYNNPTVSLQTVTNLCLVFGCTEIEAKSVYQQGADGVMGLTMSSTSFLNQIFDADNSENTLGEKQFAHCFGTNAGLLVFGSLQIVDIINTLDIELKWTPFITTYNNNGWYKVKTVGFKVESTSNSNKNVVDINYTSSIETGFHGSVIDIGSSTLSLPRNIAIKIKDSILELVDNAYAFEWIADHSRNYDYFLQWNGETIFTVSEWKVFETDYMHLFPDIVMLWDAADQKEPVEFRISAGKYLLFKGTHICLDLFGDVQSVLVGSNVMFNKLIVYDVDNLRLGVFDDIDCDLLAIKNETDEIVMNENKTDTDGIVVHANETSIFMPGISSQSRPKSWIKSYVIIYFTLLTSVLLVYCTYQIQKAKRDGLRYRKIMEFKRVDDSIKEIKVKYVESRKSKKSKLAKSNENEHFIDAL